MQCLRHQKSTNSHDLRLAERISFLPPSSIDMEKSTKDASTVRCRRDTIGQSEMGVSAFKYDDDDVSPISSEHEGSDCRAS